MEKLMPTLRSENLVNVLTECFSSHQGKSILSKYQQGFKMLARFSDLKVGISELSFRLCSSQLRSNHF